MKSGCELPTRLRYALPDDAFAGKAGLKTMAASNGISRTALVCLAMLAQTLVPIAAAQSSPGSHPCASEVEPAKRLACYDEVFPPSPAVLEAAASKGQREFGLEQRQPPLGGQEPASDPGRIEATVVRVAYQPNGSRTVTLDNEQAWSLPEATNRGHLEAGDLVQVRKAALGSYMLMTPAGVPLRARRIR